MLTRTVLAALSLLSVATLSAHALEATASGNTVQQSNMGLDLKIDAATAALTYAIGNCARQSKFYTADASVAGRDAEGCVAPASATPFDPTKLEMNTGVISYKVNGHRMAAEEITVKQGCIQAGYNGISGYGSNQYNSPGNNRVSRWDGANWSTAGAKWFRHATNVTCYKFGLRP